MVKNRWLVWMALTAVCGCAPVVTNYAGVSTHTLQVAPDKQVDVVWVQQYRSGDGFALMRCHNAPEGPTCVRAKTP